MPRPNARILRAAAHGSAASAASVASDGMVIEIRKDKREEYQLLVGLAGLGGAPQRPGRDAAAKGKVID